MALQGYYLGFLGTLNGIFSFFFFYKMYLFAITACFFFLFQIKTCGFHLKEEGKELLGMLMAALANNNGYYVLYLFLLSFSNSKLLFLIISWHQPKVLIVFRQIWHLSDLNADKTCQLLSQNSHVCSQKCYKCVKSNWHIPLFNA